MVNKKNDEVSKWCLGFVNGPNEKRKYTNCITSSFHWIILFLSICVYTVYIICSLEQCPKTHELVYDAVVYQDFFVALYKWKYGFRNGKGLSDWLPISIDGKSRNYIELTLPLTLLEINVPNSSPTLTPGKSYSLHPSSPNSHNLLKPWHCYSNTISSPLVCMILISSIKFYCQTDQTA